MTGSEGTLGVIVEATVRLRPIAPGDGRHGGRGVPRRRVGRRGVRGRHRGAAAARRCGAARRDRARRIAAHLGAERSRARRSRPSRRARRSCSRRPTASAPPPRRRRVAEVVRRGGRPRSTLPTDADDGRAAARHPARDPPRAGRVGPGAHRGRRRAALAPARDVRARSSEIGAAVRHRDPDGRARRRRQPAPELRVRRATRCPTHVWAAADELFRAAVAPRRHPHRRARRRAAQAALAARRARRRLLRAAARASRRVFDPPGILNPGVMFEPPAR